MKRALFVFSIFFIFSFNLSAQDFALSLDGNDAEADHVMVNSFSDGGTGSLTIEAWVKVDALKLGFMSIVDFNGDAPFFGFNQNNLVIYVAGGIRAAQDFTPYIGTWTHVASTITNTEQKLFINGVEVSYASDGGGIVGPGNAGWTASGTSFGIGRFTGSDGSFDGNIDEVRIWSSLRTQGEIDSNKGIELTGLESGLQAYYNFNEGTGLNVVDATGNGYDGVLLNGTLGDEDGATLGPIWSTDVPLVPINNIALDFDATNDYVSLSDWSLGAGDVTIEFWLNPNTTHQGYVVGNRTIEGSGAGNWFIVGTTAGGKLQWEFGASSDGIFTSVSNYTTGTWQHVAFVREGDQFYVYLDGVLDVTGTKAVRDFTVASGNALIGGWQDFNQRWYDGQIDDLRIWNTARTEEQIIAFKDEELNGTEPGLVGYYNFNENAGTDLFDLASNDGFQDGTLVNMDPGTDWVISSNTLFTPAPLDGIAPSVTISSSETGTTLLSPFPITFTFDEFVTGFGVADISVDNAVIENLTTVDNITFTAEVFPTTSFDVSVEIFSGEVVDLTGNVNNPSNLFQIFANPPTNALSLNGSTDYVLATEGLSFIPNEETDSYTMELWFNTQDNTVAQTLISFTADDAGSTEPTTSIFITATGELRFISRSSESGTFFVDLTGGVIENDRWHHAAITVDNQGGLIADHRLYLDGTEVASSISTAIFDATNDYADRDKFILGTAWNGTGPQVGTQLLGEIDEVRVWAVARQDFEIQSALYLPIDPQSEPNLTLYYSFNQDSGSGDVADLTGNGGTNGALIGSPDYVLSEAMSPTLYQVSQASTSGFTINWKPLNTGGVDVFLDINDSPDFLGTSIVSDQNTGDAAMGSTSILASLSSGTPYYARIYFDNSLMTSSYSETVGFYSSGGYALPFSTSEYVSIPHDDVFDLAAPFTVEFWFNTTASGNVILVEKGNNNLEWSIQQSSGGKIIMNIGNNITQTVGTSWNTGQWHHVAAVYRGVNDVTIYMDGVDDTDTPLAGTPNYATYDGAVTIGGRTGASGNLQGSVDELRVWSDERTLGEINSSLYSTLAGTEDNLVAYYRFDEASGTTLTDLAGNNDGALTNMTGTEWVLSGALQSSTPPASPTALIAYAVSDTEIQFEWSDNANNETLYEIEYDVDETFATANVIQFAVNTDNTLLDLGQDQGYFFRLTAVNDITPSANSPVTFATTQGHPGTALDFDGVDDAVNVGDNIEGLANVTIEAWVYYTEAGAVYNEIFTKEFVNSLGIDPTHKIWWHVGDGSAWTGSGVASTSEIPRDQWTHIAVTWDGTTAEMYINGRLDHSESHIATMGTNALDRGIGNYGNFNSNPFEGSIDELKVWDFVKTDFSDRNVPLFGNEFGLLSYYTFDENLNGATVFDRSVNEINGTSAGPLYLASGATAPSELVTQDNAFQVELQWVDNTTNEEGFTVERSTTAAFSAIDFSTTVPTNTTSFTDNNNWAFESDYFYRVSANLPGAVQSAYTYTKYAQSKADPGSAYSFDGMGNFVDLGTNLNTVLEGGTELTLEAWVFPTTSNNEQTLIGSYDNVSTMQYLLRLQGTGAIFYLGTGPTTFQTLTGTSATIPINTWTHVAATYDGSNMRLFINGVQDGAAVPVVTSLQAVSGIPVTVGGLSTSQYFTGSIDEVRIWKTAQTAQDILDKKDGELEGNEQGLIAYYTMDEKAGTIAYDRSVNNNNGINNGAGIVATSEAMDTGLTPDVPTGLTTSKVSDTEIQINWTDGANEQGYRIIRADDYAFTTNLLQVGDVGADITTFTDNIGGGGSAFYLIESYNGINSEFSVTSEFGTVEDHPGYAMDFSGSSASYIQSSTHIGPTGNYAYELWFKPAETLTAGSGRQDLFDHVSGTPTLIIDREGDGTIRFYETGFTQGTNPTSTTTTWEANRWYHVAVTYDGTDYNLYVDGVLEGSLNRPGVTESSSNLVIGNSAAFNSGFNGAIDEMRIWNLVKPDFSDRYTPLQGTEAGLVAYYPFDENIGTTTVDRSVNTYDGTINGGATFVQSDFTAPTDLHITRVDDQNIQLDWTDNSAEDGFSVQYMATYGGPVTEVEFTAANVTSTTLNVGPNFGGFYQISAITGDDAAVSAIDFGTTETFPGYALEFDGANDFVSIPDADELSFGDGTSDSPMAVEAWINLDQITSRSIVSKRAGGQNEWHVVISSDSRVSVLMMDQSTGGFIYGESPVFAFNIGEWYHIAFTYDGSGSGSGINTYINGALQAQNPGISGTYSAMENTTSDVEIGTINSGASTNFDGEIDEIKIWDFAKLDFTDRFSQPAGNEAGLVAYYSFDENIGTKLVDNSINDNTGDHFGDVLYVTSEAGLLSAPSNLTAFVNNSLQPQLDWDDDPSAVNYIVERSLNDNTNYTQVGTPTSNSFIDATADDGEFYYYRVSSFDGANNSLPSNEVIADIQGPGHALSFNGTDEYVSTTYQSLPNGLTFSAWINTNATATGDAYDGNSALTIVGDNANTVYLTFGIDDGYVQYHHNINPTWFEFTGTRKVNDGEWHHVAVTHDDITGDIVLYVDGEVDITDNLSYGGNTPGFNTIGASYLNGSGYAAFFDGSLDELKIRNTAYTLEAIRNEMYQTDLADPSLVAYYDFDQVDGFTLPDLKSGIDGTLLGGFTGDNTDWLVSNAIKPFIYQVTAVSTESFQLNFLQVEQATGYEVEIATDQSFASPVLAGFVASNQSPINIPQSIVAGQEYFARIQYESGSYTSGYSDAVSFYVIPGYALDFDAVDDLVDLGDIMPATYTKEAWILIPSLSASGNHNIISGDPSEQHAFWVTNQTGGTYNLATGHNASYNELEDPVLFPEGVWQHVAVTFDATTDQMILYRNGQEVAQGTVIDYVDGGGSTHLGSYDDLNFLGGVLDEVRIWRTVRTPEEIVAYQYSTLVGNEEGLVSYYSMDQITGTVVEDKSINQNEGTWSGSSGANASPNWVLSTAFTVDEFLVTNTNDAGAGSLRQAIIDANASSANEVNINFNIAGLGPWIIEPLTELDAIVKDGVTIDAGTQPDADFATTMLPMIDGNQFSGDGLIIEAADIEIYGLLIQNTTNAIDIVLESADGGYIGSPESGNIFLNNTRDVNILDADNWTIQGNNFGVEGDGLTTNASVNPVYLDGDATFIQIGGNIALNEGNIIASSSTSAYLINASATTSDINVQGNLLGIGLDGFTDITTSRGIFFNGSDNIIVGGNDPFLRNYFGGIQGSPITIIGVNNGIIQNNFIGIGVDGTTIVSNTDHGIAVSNTSTNILISENVISGATGTGKAGVYIDQLVGDVTIANNIIGLNALGDAVVSNTNGIESRNSSSVSILDNLISGNTAAGIYIHTGSSDGYTVQGNIIGLDASGSVDLGNGTNGIRLYNGAESHTIGGINPGEENVISGNDGDAILIDANSDNNFVYGNIIGKSVDLSSDIPNGSYGINILSGNNNTIGSAIVDEENYITNGSVAGVFIGGGSIGNTIIGNAFEGNTAGIVFNNTGIPNNNQGYAVIEQVGVSQIIGYFEGSAIAGEEVHVYTNDLSNVNQGGILVGSYTATGGEETWVIGGSFDLSFAYQISLTNPTNGTSEFFSHLVVNNEADAGIGTLRASISLLNATENGGSVSFDLGAGPYTISPVTQLDDIVNRIIIDATTDDYYNFIPGIAGDLITLDGSGCTSCDGFFANNSNATIELYGMRISNFTNGVRTLSGTAPSHTIGDVGKGNIFVNNSSNALYIEGFNNTDITIQSNLIGLEFNNDLAPNNGGIRAFANGMIIGGPLASERNIISGNTTYGLYCDGTTGSIIENNYFGTTIDGLSNQDGSLNNLGNGFDGIFVGNGTSSMTINDNIIGSNGSEGIYFQTNNDSHIIRNNIIGTDASETQTWGNGSDGIFFDGVGSSLNTIRENTIANNTGNGVFFNDATSNQNVIRNNSIFNNSVGGISGGNDGIASPTITDAFLTSAQGIAGIGQTVELYFADINGQGESIIDSVNTDGIGAWAISNIFIPPGTSVVATTTGTSGTSSFSVAQNVEGRNSLHFDGTDDYVSIPHDPKIALDADFSVTAWINIDNIGTDEFRTILSKRENSDFTSPFALGISTRSAEGGIDGSPSVYAYIGDGTSGFNLISSGTQDIIGQWTHLAFSISGTDMRLYLNGIEVANATYSGTRPQNTHQFELGTELSYGSYFDGKIDDLILFNAPLDPNDLDFLMEAELGFFEIIPLYFDFEVCSGGIVPDLSGNNFQGTLNNFDFNAGSDWDQQNAIIGSAPSVQVLGLTVSDVFEEKATISWTPGDGEKTIIFLKETATAELEGAINATTYFASTDFGAGTQLPPNFHAVYNGYGNTVDVSNLQELTDYRVLAMSYNDCAGSEQYLSSLTEGQSAINFQTIKIENALDLNGTDDFVDFGAPSPFVFELDQGDRSIETWIKMDALPTDFMTILANNVGSGFQNKWAFVYSENYSGVTNNLSLIQNNGTAASFIEPPIKANLLANQWYHVAIAVSGGNAEFFLNGTSLGTVAIQAPVSVGANVTIGQTEGIGYLDGQIDEVRVWGYAKDEVSVSAEIFNELDGTETDLLAYYNFNQGIAGGDNTTIIDLFDKSSLTNDGDIQSLARNGTSSNFIISTAFDEQENLINAGPAGTLLSATSPVDADGLSVSNITLQLKSESGTNINRSGVNVTFNENSATAALSASTAFTNASGLASITMTNTVDELVFVTATVDHDNNGGTAALTITNDGDDLNGNVEIQFLDVTPPATPTVVALNTNDPTPTLTGTAEANSTVTVVIGGATYTVTADGTGNWSVDTGTATPISGTFSPDVNGANEVTVTSTDAAGNSTSDITSNEIIIDTTAPSGYALANLSVDNVNEELNFEITGAEVGATYDYSVISDGGGSLSNSGTVNGTTESLGPIDLSALNYGTLTVSVFLTDASFNSGSPVNENIIYAAPIITILSPNGGETFTVGDQVTITWTDNFPSTDLIEFYYTTDGGVSYSFFDDGNFGLFAGDTYSWTVPAGAAGNTQVEIRNTTQSLSDISDGTFIVNAAAVSPDVTISSLAITGSSVDQGETDALIYKFQYVISGGDITFEGLYFELSGDFIASDFVTDGFELTYNIGSDDFTASKANTLGLSTFNSGTPFPPNSIGWLLTQSFIDGQNVFFYVSADISGTAGITNNFSVVAPTLDNFGIADPKNKISGTINAGTPFSIQAPSDVTAPTFTSLTTGDIFETSIDASFTLDETGTVYFVAVGSGDTPPTSAEVVDPGSYLGAIESSGFFGPSATGTLSFTGLFASTTYDLYFVAEDGSFNLSSVPDVLTNVTTSSSADVIAPVFTSLTTGDILETSIDVNFTLDETGTVYFVAVGSGDTPPTSAEVVDPGSYLGAIESSGFFGPSATGTLSFTGLFASTNYDLYFVAEDGSFNLSSVPDVLTNVTTSSSADVLAPVFTSLTTGDILETSIDVNFTLDETGTVYFVAVGSGDTPPTSAEVVDPGSYLGAIESSGFFGPSATGTLSFTGLFASTTYDLYFVAEDGSFNLSSVPEALTNVTTSSSADVIAPVFTSLTTGDILETSIDVNFTLDETGTVYFVALGSGDTPPTSAEVVDPGTFAGAIESSGFFGPSATGTLSFTGLFASTTYDLYFVAEDGSFNLSSVPEALTNVTTSSSADVIAPVFTSLTTGDILETSIDVNFSLDETGTVYFVAVGSGDTPPTSAEVVDPGTFAGAIESSGFFGPSATGTLSFTGLFASTTYDLYFVAEDGSFNLSSVPEALTNVTTSSSADVIAPVFTSLTTGDILETSIDVNFSLDETGTVYFVAVGSGDTPPTSAEVVDPGTFAGAIESSGFFGPSATGTLSFTGLFASTTYDLYFVAEDGSFNLSSVPEALTNVTTSSSADVIAPVFTSAASVAIDENIASGIIYTAVATDASALTYSISGADAASFSINSTTGDLTIVSSPDFETQGNYAVTITATDALSNFADLNLTVTVNDLDENAPIFTSAVSVAIDESIASGIIYTAVATDASALTYSISGADAASFSINSTSGDLTILSSPDFETQGSYAVTITATDALSNFADLNLTVTVNDLDENAPIFTSAVSVAIDENIASGIIYTAVATDASALTYSISGADAASFSINSTSGDLTILSSPDFETQGSYAVMITATDALSNFADLNLSVTVNDLDEIAPIISGTPNPSIVENTTVVGMYNADEAVSWSLAGDDASLFTVDGVGNVSFLVAPDFETPSDLNTDNVYEVTVEGTDIAGNVGSLNVTITITDENDNAPVITPIGEVDLAENSLATTALVDYAAIDADANSSFIWSILSGNTDVDGDTNLPFLMNASNGVITVNDAGDLDFESGTTRFELAIGVSDGVNDDATTLTVNILDVQEDITSPTVVLSTTEVSPTNSSSILVTITFDEEVEKFTIDSLTLTNATASTFTGTGAVYTVNVSPIADGELTVAVLTGKAEDLAGNPTSGSNVLTMTSDQTRPSVEITSTLSPVTNASVIPMTITFSEAVTGFTEDDLTIFNGAFLSLTGSGAVYVLEVSTDSEGDVVVQTINNAAEDAAGNRSTTSGQFRIESDQTGPSVTVASKSSSNDSPEITGSVSETTAGVTVTISGNTYTAANNGDGSWTLSAGSINSLAVNTYQMTARATDVAGNESSAVGTLQIIGGPTVALAPTEVTFTSFRANWRARTGVVSYRFDLSRNATFTKEDATYKSFSTTSNTLLIENRKFNTKYYYRVRAVYADGSVSKNSNVIAFQTQKDPATSQDSTALISIYDALGGEDWTKNQNWTVGLRIQDWDGIDFAGGTRVKSVDLSGSNLQGDFPVILEGLEELTNLNLSNNEVTNVPALTNLSSLTTLNVSNNKLEFGSLEFNLTVDNYTISPQKAVLDEADSLLEIGNTYVLSRAISGSANNYIWRRQSLTDPNSITTLSSTGTTHEVVVNDFDVEGNYFVEVRSSVSGLTGLTLTSNVISVKVSSLGRDIKALQAIYNATDGANWTAVADWNTMTTTNLASFAPEVGLSTNGDRVTTINLQAKGLSGVIPKAINDIAGLTSVNLSENQLSGLPTMTRLKSLTTLRVSDNYLDFGDLEKNVNIPGISYIPQAIIEEVQADTVRRGTDYLINFVTGGTKNTYSWRLTNDIVKGEIVLRTDDGTPVIRKRYLIEDINYENMGAYTVTVTNSLVPDLTLQSAPIGIYASAEMEFIVLGTVGNNVDQPLQTGVTQPLRIIAPDFPFDSVATQQISGGKVFYESLVLGDYLVGFTAQRQNFLPTYYTGTFLWEEADTLILRDDFSDTVFMQRKPVPLRPGDGEGKIFGGVEADLPDNPGGRILERRKVKKAGCSVRRFKARGRGENGQDGTYELVAYVETNDNGEFEFNFLPAGTYRFNIEYPGVPMDPDSFIEIEIGGDGFESNNFRLDAFVQEGGIAVERVSALAIYAQYFWGLDVYPIPANERITIRYDRLLADEVEVKMVDMRGETVLTQPIRRGWDESYELDVSQLAEGTYLLHFMDPIKGSVVAYKVYVRH